MKKFLYSVLFLFVVLIACSKEEEPTPPPTPKFTVSISAGDGGSVSTEGGTYDQGTKVTVTATPDGGFLFDKWSDGNTDNPREITVTSNLSLTANFVKKKYALTVNIEGEGTVQEEVIVQGSTSTTEYNSGTNVRLTATPSDEWVFSGWSGSVESTDNPIEVSVDEAKEITATFKLKQYDLTINIEGEGTVSETIITQPTLYDSGTVVKLEAIPSEGWEFVGWSGSVESTENPIEVSVDETKEITATFKLKQYDLTITIEGEGTVSETIVTQPTLYDSGTVVKLEATPSDEWVFSDWSGSVESTDNPIEVSVDEAKEITAKFLPSNTKFTLQIINESGRGFVTDLESEMQIGFEQLNVNSLINLLAIPRTGYKFLRWSGNFDSSENPLSIKMNDNIQLTPIFEKNLSSTIDINLTKTQVPISEKPLFSYSYSENGMKILTIENDLYVISQGNGWKRGMDLPKAYQLKLDSNNQWIFHREYDDVKFKGIRNDELVDNSLLFTDHDEHPEDPEWKGHLWVADVSSEQIEWNKVTTEEEQSYFHGGGLGDVNGDGLIDVIGTAFDYQQIINDPDFFSISYQTSGPMIWVQKSPGNFEIAPEFFTPKDLRMGHAAAQLDDLDNDGIPEVITGPYLIRGDFDLTEEEIESNVSTFNIYKQNMNQEYISVFKSPSPNPFYDTGSDMGLTRIDCEDLNNDGYKDLILSREGTINSSNEGAAVVEIWINNKDLTFKELFTFDRNYNIQAIPLIYDLDNDGDLDFVLRSSKPMNVVKNPQYPWKSEMDLGKLIMLNNGDGTFSNYNRSITLKGYDNYQVYPYIYKEKLGFFLSHSQEDGCSDCGDFHVTTYFWVNVFPEL